MMFYVVWSVPVDSLSRLYILYIYKYIHIFIYIFMVGTRPRPSSSRVQIELLGHELFANSCPRLVLVGRNQKNIILWSPPSKNQIFLNVIMKSINLRQHILNIQHIYSLYMSCIFNFIAQKSLYQFKFSTVAYMIQSLELNLNGRVTSREWKVIPISVMGD